MSKICICGHFGGTKEFLDGQTVKTKNIYMALCQKYGENAVTKLDTYNWKKKPITFLIKCIKAVKNNENIIMLPAHNGVKVFVPLFSMLKRIYGKRVMYVVIGGWLSEFLQNRNY